MSDMDRWPYPGDSRTVRDRRVAGAYRQALLDADPAACAELDARMLAWGQKWVVPRAVIYDPNAWLTPAEASDLSGLTPAALAGYRRSGRLVARRRDNRGYEYLASGIAALSAQPRTREGAAR